jgi:hypothetical protein
MFKAVCVIAMIIVATLVAAAVDERDPAEPEPGPMNTANETRSESKTLAQNMREARADHEAELAALEERCASASTHQQAIDLQWQMRDLKLGFEINLLEIQAEDARERGNDEQVKVLVRTIEAAQRLLSTAERRAVADDPKGGDQ